MYQEATTRGALDRASRQAFREHFDHHRRKPEDVAPEDWMGPKGYSQIRELFEALNEPALDYGVSVQMNGEDFYDGPAQQMMGVPVTVHKTGAIAHRPVEFQLSA